jgi:hypothetical protein
MEKTVRQAICELLTSKRGAFLKAVIAILFALTLDTLSEKGYLPRKPYASFSVNWEFYISYLVLLIFIVESVFSHIAYSDYTQTIQALDTYKDLCTDMLQSTQFVMDHMLEKAGHELGFDKQPQKIDRITLYALIEEDKEFFAVSRFSENSTKRKINDDKKYPMDKGCIKKAYDNGFFFTTLPSKRNFGQYIEAQSAFGYSPEEVTKMSMHSRLYAAQRIETRSGVIGVIVLESELPGRFKEEKARQSLTFLSEHIGVLLEVVLSNVTRIDISFNSYKLTK